MQQRLQTGGAQPTTFEQQARVAAADDLADALRPRPQVDTSKPEPKPKPASRWERMRAWVMQRLPKGLQKRLTAQTMADAIKRPAAGTAKAAPALTPLTKATAAPRPKPTPTRKKKPTAAPSFLDPQVRAQATVALRDARVTQAWQQRTHQKADELLGQSTDATAIGLATVNPVEAIRSFSLSRARAERNTAITPTPDAPSVNRPIHP